jgi:hypothetical protein
MNPTCCSLFVSLDACAFLRGGEDPLDARTLEGPSARVVGQLSAGQHSTVP